ncbi:hypothetical protein ILYODFUR_031538 [Ilyodon furcidens]|uniref:Uncharacterized protein n=1 Tax=Ilyodon furcidens TaxID=33524 RepID=A0ABV0T5K6_9TELE
MATISSELLRSSLYETMARKVLVGRKALKVSFAGTQTCGRRCSDQMKPKMNFFTHTQNAIYSINSSTSHPKQNSYSETLWWQHHAVGMLFFSIDRQDDQS